MHRMEKLVAQMAGAQGVTIPPEAMVEPPLTDEQGNATAESQANPDPSSAQAEAGGGAPGGEMGGGTPPPGGDIGMLGGMDAMAGPKMAAVSSVGYSSTIGRGVPRPVDTMNKAAAVAQLLQRRNAQSRNP